MLDPDYSPETPGRLAKLENAISKQRTVRFDYWSISRDKESERTLNPYALAQRQRALVRRRPRPRPRGHPHVPRLAHPRRHQVRDAARARLPRADRLRRRARTAAGRRGRSATSSAPLGSRCAATRPGGCGARYGTTGTLEDDVFVTEYSSIPQLASWVLRQNGRAVPLEPHELQARGRAPRCGACAKRHEGERAAAGPREAGARPATEAVERPAGPGRAGAVRRAAGAARLPPRRLRRGARGRDPGDGAARALPLGPADELEEHLSLLNLVNFGGGCYTVYAELRDGDGARRQGAVGRHVPRRAAPDAARGARDPARARVRRPDDRRRRAHAARRASARSSRRRSGSSSSPRRPSRTSRPRKSTSSRGSRAAMRERRLVEIEYQKEADAEPSHAARRAVLARAAAAELVRPHLGPHERRPALVPPRPDAEREADTEKFEPREGFEPTRLRDARTAKVLYAQGDRALGDRARRTPARRRERRARPAGRQRRVARRARSSHSAAKPCCSSPTSCGRRSRSAPRRWRRSSASSECASAPRLSSREPRGCGRAPGSPGPTRPWPPPRPIARRPARAAGRRRDPRATWPPGSRPPA